MDTWITILVLGSSGWLYGDAKNIGVKKGQVKGLANMSPMGWFVACPLLWVVNIRLGRFTEFQSVYFYI